MVYHAKIEVFENPEKLLKCLAPELKHAKTARSSLTFVKKRKSIVFKIKAKDSTALRAVFNGITKLCTVYEKINSIK